MKNYKTIILFGCLLAILAVMLQFFEYKYFIGKLDTNVYTSVAINDENLKALKLNDREYEILQLIAKGHSNKEIAKTLFLAIPTIKTHTSNLYAKLDVRSRTQAVHKAREMRIL